MLIDAEIMAPNRNPNAMGPPALPIFHHCTKFDAETLIDARIMAQNRKLKMTAVRHLGIIASSYRTTHDVFALVHISLSNFMLIRFIVF